MNFEKLLKEAVKRKRKSLLEMLGNKSKSIDFVRLFDMSGKMSNNKFNPEIARKNLENVGFCFSFEGNKVSLLLQK